MPERTVRGCMADAHVSISELAKVLKMSRSTLSRKLDNNSFTVKEAHDVCEYLKVRDAQLKVDLFLI